MPAPTRSPQGARLRERTLALAPDDEHHGWAHAYLCEALGTGLEQVGQVFDPDGDVPPLAPLFDVRLCPAWALPWLAQLVGVALPAGVSADDARVIISDVAGFARGTPASLRAAAGLFLTGHKTVYFRERDGDPYVLEVITVTSETPDPDAVLAAILAQKPGGIVVNYRQVDAWDYQQMTAQGGKYSALPARYATYIHLSYDERTT